MSQPLAQPHTIYLSLGTNLGDRRANLQQALRRLPAGLNIVAISPVYETPPWGMVEQPAFLNLCLSAETKLTPRALLTFLKKLETELGRVTAQRWGPRLIDIDILFYDDLVYEDDVLTIPHPSLAERAFVLGPLRDIAPGLRHPRTGRSVAEMAAAIDLNGLAPAGFSFLTEQYHEQNCAELG
ncbi:MAG: 2-amino-4-hydroxy-6-hydroxymethyldihydropteridine diphosphokinase [Anaerolineales bacterium]|nr:2-amino-4-hydroxy-6-hydroxymethyldihydropteridine diphosphokinase [Anaerolineales bacterium]MCB0015358.1 2-amino-4-hydroxy-6-hydroxymethyldihydropteridine diphosphokinase [Anaerolineales bacterium]MCB0029906.1 2-amino-4-hydroxy-6-hydroxymethyldihydropteridine diphosphokinase [Anaerolineales bacterium]